MQKWSVISFVESGLLSLIIPKSLSGNGENWKTVFQITREACKSGWINGSFIRLSFFMLDVCSVIRSQNRREKLYRETAENDSFWGNAFNPRDENLVVKKEGNSVAIEWKEILLFRCYRFRPIVDFSKKSRP